MGQLLLIGCGKMGQAMLSGWLRAISDPATLPRSLMPETYTIIEPTGLPVEFLKKNVILHSDLADLPSDYQPDIVVLAVKPQILGDLLPSCRQFVRSETVFLSIAAGINLARLTKELTIQAVVSSKPMKPRLVRAMPNTPAAVARGISVACAGPEVNIAQKTSCTNLLTAVGEACWIEDEALMDVVTSVSGSGPAYVFFMIEALAQAGIKAGLPAVLASQLAKATIEGAGELSHLSDLSAAQLRTNVTSPGGTTQAALEVLMAPDGLVSLLTRTVAAAAARSRELSSINTDNKPEG